MDRKTLQLMAEEREKMRADNARFGRTKADQANVKSFLLAVIILAVLIAVQSCTLAHAFEADLSAIKSIESSGNPFAFNSKSKARGLYQITPICLKEYNDYHPHQKVSPMELFIPEVNERVAKWYLLARIPQMLRYYGHPVSMQTVLASYNWGIGKVVNVGVENMPRETREYIEKYKRLVSNEANY